jgi:ribosomal-protein-alanine N-acetyltransferase
VSTRAGTRVALSPVATADCEEFVASARDSVDLHRGLISVPLSASEFAEYVERFDGVSAAGFVIRVNDTGRLAGLVNIRDIARSGGVLGFGGFTATAGNGYVAEGVLLAVRYAFAELGLDHLEALVQPGNTASRRLLEKAGFLPVRSALKTVFIDGVWRDHQLWMIKARTGE